MFKSQLPGLSPPLVLLFAMSLFSCAGQRPDNLGIVDGRLSPCPSSPNCVSSDATDTAHAVEALRLKVPALDAWQAAKQTVTTLPRISVVTQTRDYLHAECRSAVFGFVDDLELHLRETDGTIAVRSASRLGYSDFGVNRKRVEQLRSMLQQQGIIE